MITHRFKQSIFAFTYRHFVKPVFFLFDPERIHHFFIRVGEILGSNAFSKGVTRFLFDYSNSLLEQDFLGIHFKNPVGLAAGFDKDAKIISVIEDVGFGFSEVGSATALSCAGNGGIRMKRLIPEQAIWVNLGLNNDGALAISNRLSGKKYAIPYGVNIARTNCKETANEDVAVKDYCQSLKTFSDANLGAYYVLNISCPNAYGGQPFSGARLFEKLLTSVLKLKIKKPIFVKLSPDLSHREIDDIILLSRKYKISGFICTNLTKDASLPSGGYSGKLVEEKANALLSYVYQKTRGEFVLIGLGGIFSAEDAYKKIKLGANLVQLVSGMIFMGPQLIGQINLGLAELLKKDGYKSISEAVGRAYST